MNNDQPKANKTDAGNGSKAICRVSNVLRSPSPDPRRSAKKSMGPRVTDENLNRIIARRFSASLMSNHKWVKLLDSMVRHARQLISCRVKLVWDDSLRDLAISEDSQFRLDYWESAVEGMASGKPTGWFGYKEFEFVEIEFKTPQGCIDFEQSLRALGQFEMDVSPSRILVYAYSTNRAEQDEQQQPPLAALSATSPVS